MHRAVLPLIAATVLLAGCNDSTAPRDVTPPAAPRGVTSITGDHEVFLDWLENTEADVEGYRVYQAPCASGDDCPYDRVGSTSGTELVVRDLANGVTRFYAVAAYDRAGNESALSFEDVFDTPRPEGFGRTLENYLEQPSISGYDFSAFAVRPYDHGETDIYFGTVGGVSLMIALHQDTEIQDAGYATQLDAVDFAPSAGWAPSGTVELIAGHCYVVKALDHFAKFRVTSLTPSRVQFDWAYQVDAGNRELKARRTDRPVRVRRPAVGSS